MAEDFKHLNKSKQHLLKLTLYSSSSNIPLCCCWNTNYENCLNLMMERIKYLFCSWQIYKYIFYHILIRPIITFSTWWIMIIVAVNVGLLGFPIWYHFDDKYFKDNNVILGWRGNGKCHWSDNDDFGVICDKDYIWIEYSKQYRS